MESNVNIKIKLKNNAKLLGTAKISFETAHFGPLTIKGFMIWRSDLHNERLGDHVNITAPSTRSRFGYTPQVFFEGRNHWEVIEQKIYEAFRIEGGESLHADKVEDLDDLVREVN